MRGSEYYGEHYGSPGEGFLLSHEDLSHFAQLILGFLRYNAVNGKVTLGVIDQTEFSPFLSVLMTFIKPVG